MTRFIAEFGTGQVFWSMLWFFLFFIWIWLLIVVFSDIFRSHDMRGGAKAFWVIFVIILPYLGVLRLPDRARPQDAGARRGSGAGAGRGRRSTSSRRAGHQSSAADEIARLADLKDQGVITDAEFQAGKAKALSGS